MRSKRLICLLLVIMACLMQLSLPANAESVRNKKVVSIVYDDSGSMHMDDQLKWAYANYAMQAFAGMLNKEDVLMINYMSSVQQNNNRPVVIDTTNRVNSVNEIRMHSASGDTPFKAIDGAYENLKSYQDNNLNTQYWLVVMTDGEFNETELSAVENKLVSIAGEKMSNGSLPQIIYFSMCDTQDNFTPKNNLKNNISIKRADEAKDIAETISDISDEISGRYSVSDNEIKLVDDRTIEVSSKIPLVNIGVLTQFSEAEVTDVKVDGGTSITVESNVGIKYPEVEGRKTDTSLTGNVALAGNGSSNIPAGRYTITFSAPIAKEEIDVMFEPAIELRLILTSDGEEVKDVSKIQIGTELCATAELYEMGTDNIIDLKLLPSGIVQSIKHTEDNELINEVNGNIMENIIVGDKLTIISASYELPGYFNLRQAYEIDPVDITVTGITAELQNDGSPRKNGDDLNVIYVTGLKNNKTGIKYTLYIDNAPIDKETAQMVLTKFKKGIETDLKNVKVEVQDDGTFLVYPSKNRLWGWDAIYSLLYGGEHTVTATVDGNSAEGTLNLKGGNLMIDIWLLIFVVQFISFFFTKKFSGIRIKYRRGTVNIKHNDPFFDEELHLAKVPLANAESPFWHLVLSFIPIAGGIYGWLPPYVKVEGFAIRPTAIKSTSVDIIGLKQKPNITVGEYTTPDILPSYVSKDEARFAKNVKTVSSGQSILIAINSSEYVEIRIEIKKKK